MNFTNLMQESLSQDFNRLIELCSSYGLNEQETNQIISDFKNGSFAQQDQSIDQSFQQSIREIDSNHGDQSVSVSEEYSFKHQKNGPALSNTHGMHAPKQLKKEPNFQHLISNNNSFEQEPRQARDSGNYGMSQQLLEFFVNQRNDFEKNIQTRLEQQNDRLRQELKQKEQTISALMKMKIQDSEIILGLKQSLTFLTNSMQEKDQSYRYLAQKYEKLKVQNQCISTQKTSKVQLSHQESLNSFEQRKSLMRQKEHCVTQIEPVNRMVKKSSQKYIKEPVNRNNSKLLQRSNIENRENLNKNEQSKRSGIDISKYKGMIEKLRNSYQFR